MTMSATMPVVTLLFASLLVLFKLVLLARVSMVRRSRNVGIGSGGDPLLQRRVRVHANFVEQVPVALLLMALLEMAGLGRTWLWAFGALLLLGRLLHAAGLSRSAGYSSGRLLGTVLSWGVLFAEALAGLVLVARHLG